MISEYELMIPDGASFYVTELQTFKEELAENRLWHLQLRNRIHLTNKWEKMTNGRQNTI